MLLAKALTKKKKSKNRRRFVPHEENYLRECGLRVCWSFPGFCRETHQCHEGPTLKALIWVAGPKHVPPSESALKSSPRLLATQPLSLRYLHGGPFTPLVGPDLESPTINTKTVYVKTPSKWLDVPLVATGTARTRYADFFSPRGLRCADVWGWKCLQPSSDRLPAEKTRRCIAA